MADTMFTNSVTKNFLRMFLVSKIIIHLQRNVHPHKEKIFVCLKEVVSGTGIRKTKSQKSMFSKN